MFENTIVKYLLKVPSTPFPEAKSSDSTLEAINENVPKGPELVPLNLPSIYSSNHNRLFIIGAGLSRTGTEAMATAMEILIGGRSYHGGTSLVIGGIAKEGSLWNDSKGILNLDKIFDSRDDGIVYNSTFDVPGIFHIEQLMNHYPNYRVILTKRNSAEEWADSVISTISPMNRQLRLLDRITFHRVGPIHRALEFVDKYSLSRELGLGVDETSRDQLIQVYNKHLEHVRKIVPADRLIEFEIGSGWKALCDGLNLPIPLIPFPRKNTRDKFRWRSTVGVCKTFAKNHWPQLSCIGIMSIFSLYVIINQIIGLF